MPIVARCSCGHKIALADVMGGRTINCPKCGQPVDVPMPSASAAGTAARKPKNATPGVAINPAILIAATLGLIVLVIVLALYFGPWTVGTQWAAMSGKANTQVTDVMEFALRAYESQTGAYDAAASHNVPMAQGEAVFIPPYMAFSMPRRIIFSGKTNQGNYLGTYDTTNGEITADIETGGFTIGGLVDAKKATGKFHITGREKNGNPEAECNGKPLKIVMQKLEND